MQAKQNCFTRKTRNEIQIKEGNTHGNRKKIFNRRLSKEFE